jgi:hypothetical protein
VAEPTPEHSVSIAAATLPDSAALDAPVVMSILGPAPLVARGPIPAAEVGWHKLRYLASPVDGTGAVEGDRTVSVGCASMTPLPPLEYGAVLAWLEGMLECRIKICSL